MHARLNLIAFFQAAKFIRLDQYNVLKRKKTDTNFGMIQKTSLIQARCPVLYPKQLVVCRTCMYRTMLILFVGYTYIFCLKCFFDR